MAGVNPDDTEAEVGNIWRNLYKLERTFEANPNATKICTKVLLQSQTVNRFCKCQQIFRYL